MNDPVASSSAPHSPAASSLPAPNHAALRLIALTATVYGGLGLASGLYYREMTKFNEFDVTTQLGLVHTHLFTLGLTFMLIVLVLERLFALSSVATWKPFFWVWQVGIALTAGMMAVKGTLQVLRNDPMEEPALAGISGLGHIALTIGMVLLFMTLLKALAQQRETA